MLSRTACARSGTTAPPPPCPPRPPPSTQPTQTSAVDLGRRLRVCRLLHFCSTSCCEQVLSCSSTQCQHSQCQHPNRSGAQPRAQPPLHFRPSTPHLLRQHGADKRRFACACAGSRWRSQQGRPARRPPSRTPPLSFLRGPSVRDWFVWVFCADGYTFIHIYGLLSKRK